MPHSSTIAASVIALIVCGMPSSSCAADAVQRVPGASWEHAAPATQGFSTRGLARAIAFAKKSGSTSGVVIHDGLIVAEWGDISSKTNLHSVRKSFASALVGVAAAQGQLRLDDTLEQLGVDDEPPALSADEKQATIRMLLEARSGVYHPATYETDGMLSEKPERHSHLPGTFWYYNNWDFNAIGAILQQASHEAFFDALKTKIADPIGMQDYAAADGHYVSGMPATRYPAYPFDMSARDLARFALLYLHGGLWGTREVVPSAWVAESTRPYSDNRGGGYGYLWWTNVPATANAPALEPPVYWAEGHLGQFAFVVPSLNMIVVSLHDPRQSDRPMHKSAMMRLLQMVEAAQRTVDRSPEAADQAATPP